MFIERIAELGLLEHSSSSNIIGKFPLDVRCVLISQMNRYMMSITEINPSSLLTSETHVIFTMELVGQGFNLPLHQLPIIEHSVSVYSGWLLDPSKRPLAIQNSAFSSDVFQNFIQNIFKQASLLFRPRLATEIHNPINKKSVEELGDLVRQHVDLCKKVISNYSKFMADYSHQLSNESWIVILKVLLGICDAILKEPIQNRKKNVEIDIEHTGSYMGDKLCELLIQTLIENWMRCSVVPVNMWDRLKSYFMTWTHRVQMINQWKQTTLDLSKQVIGDLTDRNRSIMSYISENSMPKEEDVEVQRDRLYYSWHRMLYLIQNPILLEASIFQTAIFGISRLVDEFLAFGTKLVEKIDILESPVNGNTILNMFGEWLFDGGSISRTGFEAGRAEATAVLCRIFSRLQKSEKFHSHYLRQFYTVIQQGLKADSLTLSSIIMNSTVLFLMNLEGFRMLFPDYIQALFRILPTMQASNQDIKFEIDELRRGAYMTLSNIAFSVNLYSNVSTNHSIPQNIIPEFADSPLQSWIDTLFPFQEFDQITFARLKPSIVQLLVGSLITEGNPRNARMLLNMIANYCVHEAEHTPAIYHIFIKVIQEKLLMQDHWSNDVILTSFDTLGVFSANMSTTHDLSKFCLRELVLVLCTFIDAQLKSENVVPLQTRIIRGYDLLAKLALLENWVVNDIVSQKAIMTALTKGISILDREHAFSAIETINGDQPVSVPQYLSPSTVLSLGRQIDTTRHEFSVSFAPSTNSSGPGNSSPAMQRGKKAPNRLSLAPNKRFQKLRLSFQPSGMNMVSTGSKDGGIGLPTFALLSAEIQVKTAAESVMSLLCLRISNFPPKDCCQGVSKISSTWNEINSIIHTAKVQQRLLQEKENELVSTDHRNFIRYFAYQKRVIFAFVEIPRWAENNPDKPSPSLILTTRDSFGKFSWFGSLEYKDNNARKNSLDNSVALRELKEEQQSKQVIVPTETHIHTIPNVVHLTSVNEANIPTIQELFENDFHLDIETEIKALENQSHTELSQRKVDAEPVEAMPFPVVDSFNPEFIPKSFRILLTTMGFLDVKLSSEITPLVNSDQLQAELDKLDQMQERDCFTVLVLYCRSGDDRIEKLYAPGDGCKEYEQFLWSLGWPIELNAHLGFKGTVEEGCPITPYFANVNLEIIFKCPYLYMNDIQSPSTKTSMLQLRKRTNSVGFESSISVDDFLAELPTSSKKGRRRSHSVGNALMDAQEHEPQESDIVAIIWVEDIHNLNTLLANLPPTLLICIIVYPLSNCNGLYGIRIVCRNGAPEDVQNVGPLIDNMIIGQDGFAALLRQTSTNIIKSYKIAKNGYKRPNLIRRQFIEELCNHNAGSKNGLFADILSK